MKTKLIYYLILVTTLFFAVQLGAQVEAEAPSAVRDAKQVKIERVKVHGKSLEGNLEGNVVDRDVIIYLPPSYTKSPLRRYPVVYVLHGYSVSAEKWAREAQVEPGIEHAFADGIGEFIVVLPDSKTMHGGSFYSSSMTTGNFEQFISQDLVSYMDANYRTICDRNSRGLAGHSMGGYGAARIGMKHADVFSCLYIMSPGCVLPMSSEDVDKALTETSSPEETAKLPWQKRLQLAFAAAWSPNPQNPPLYLDLPSKNGDIQPDIMAKWRANSVLAFVDQYIGNLRRYRAIAIDIGDLDGLLEQTTKLHEVLDSYGVTNRFEVYSGTHTSKMDVRFQNHVIPFFSQNLIFEVPNPNHQNCAARKEIADINYPQEKWALVTPEEVGLSAVQLEKLDALIESFGGGSGLLLRHGKIAHTWGDIEKRYEVASCTKMLTSTAMGLAVHDNKLALDDKICQYAPEITLPKDKKITIAHLLSMTSEYQRSGLPGEAWCYSGAVELLSPIINAEYNMSMANFMRNRVLKPIGAMNWEWLSRETSDGTVFSYAGYGLNISASDMARLGFLYLNNGNWNGKNIIPEEWITLATHSSQRLKPVYGYLWWVNSAGDWPEVPLDSYCALGAGSRDILFVCPCMDLIAVRLGGESLGDTKNLPIFLKHVVDCVSKSSEGPEHGTGSLPGQGN